MRGRKKEIEVEDTKVREERIRFPTPLTGFSILDAVRTVGKQPGRTYSEGDEEDDGEEVYRMSYVGAFAADNMRLLPVNCTGIQDTLYECGTYTGLIIRNDPTGKAESSSEEIIEALQATKTDLEKLL